MKAFVTGASGFLGGSLGRRLVAKGWTVHALVRSDAAAAAVDGWGARPFMGDVTEPATLGQGMEGVDAVFHTAASVDVFERDKARMMAVNVGGTRNVLQAARDSRARRFVHYSSVAAIGRKHERADESVWSDGSYRTAYEASKHGAETAAIEAGRGGLDVVQILPSVVIGPGDPKTGRFFTRYLRGGVGWRPRSDGGTSFVHVDDVTEGALLAFAKGRRGERYILSQATWTTTQLFDELNRLTQIPGPRRLPDAFVRGAARIEEWRAALRRQAPRLTVAAVEYATARREFSSAKARHELGWSPPDFRERLAETVDWWKREVTSHGAS